nr:MAG TPA: hypothetical protein [Caudoviricetes sp.]
MAKSILIPTLVAAKDIDSLNRSFVATVDLDNGNVFGKGELSTNAGESQVYQTVTPATESLTGLYMAFTAEDVVLADDLGNQYKVGTLDPRAFTNKAGVVFSGFKPQVGDLILISADGISGVANKYAVAENGASKLAFAAEAGTGLSFKVVETTYITVASANNIGSQRVTAYLLECVAN